jgi:alkylation response protein AidB-like acyl-CoA dehydrogenase
VRPALAEGQLRATLAFSEPAGRWDAAGIAATVRRDGDSYLLSGAKRYVPDGHCADLFVVAARAEGSEGEAGVSLFLLPSDAAGLEVTPLVTMDQTRRQAHLELHDVRVPASACMGEEGAAWPALRKTLDQAAVAVAAEQVGGAQRCLDLAVAYAKERVQFGRPIGSFQAIKHKCADMMLLVESARSAAYYAACVAAEDGDALPLVASLAKATGSDAYFRCAAECLQIFGGVGFTWEYDPHLYFKRAKSSEAFLGDASFHRERVAAHILGE